MQRMGSLPILCININILMDTILKFNVNANVDANVDFDTKCEWTLTAEHDSDFPFGR